jgi:hypothetical protein
VFRFGFIVVVQIVFRAEEKKSRFNKKKVNFMKNRKVKRESKHNKMKVRRGDTYAKNRQPS